MKILEIYIEENGDVRCIYDDAVADVLEDLGDAVVTRASHVEPAASFGWDHATGWLADMRPSGGPLLFESKDARGVKQPFKTRAAALAAEVAWLREHKGV